MGLVHPGYITQLYSDERVLVFMDDDEYGFIGGDLVLLGV